MIDEIEVYAGDYRMLQGIRFAIKETCGVKYQKETRPARTVQKEDFQFLIKAVRS